MPDRSIYNYDTMERMADNPDIDVVYVVTPNALHAEHTIKAATAGKHVLCEKPMEVSTEECEQMIAACAGRPGVSWRSVIGAASSRTTSNARLAQERSSATSGSSRRRSASRSATRPSGGSTTRSPAAAR